MPHFQLHDCSIAGWGEAGRSRRVARQILDNVEIPWSHEVAVMFQIVCVLALEVLEVLIELGQLKGSKRGAA